MKILGSGKRNDIFLGFLVRVSSRKRAGHERMGAGRAGRAMWVRRLAERGEGTKRPPPTTLRVFMPRAKPKVNDNAIRLEACRGGNAPIWSADTDCRHMGWHASWDS